MNSIRKLYLDFFQKKHHQIIPSASLIPENDPSVLFITAGMHPLIPYLMGEPHPKGKRLVNFQRCLRTGDIDSVGDSSHLTLFEMLGNWSLGDYFKQESIAYSFEFLFSPHYLNLDKKRIFISVFEGDSRAPKDAESAKIWETLGIELSHIIYLPKKDNWWGPVGNQGPCGPDTEIFFDTLKPVCSIACAPGCSCGKYIEIWNNVFLEYTQAPDGSLTPLKQPYVDTGMGLERISAVLNGLDSVYETNAFVPLINTLKGHLKQPNAKAKRSLRIIADHIKASVFLLAETPPITPSSSGQGYVLRRLIRRAVYEGQELGLQQSVFKELTRVVAKTYQTYYPFLTEHLIFVQEVLEGERLKFLETLEKGKKRAIAAQKQPPYRNKNP